MINPLRPFDPRAAQQSLEDFRAQAPRPRIHPLELMLLWTVSAQLIFLPWALGTMHVWSQSVSLGFSLLGFAFALIPRDYHESFGPSEHFRFLAWPRLLRFPLFWLGLAFLCYVLVQALNPAWVYETDGQGWWLRRLGHIEWLPSGMRTPFEQASPWRSLMIYSTVWLTASAVWIGFTRRRTFQIFFTVLATNGFALAGVGLVQRLEGNGKILGFITAPASYFVATFIYKNHGAAYFNLILALTAGLSYWYFIRGQRRLEKSNPAGIFAFFATALAMAVLFSFSRAGTLLMLFLLVLFLGVFVIRQLRTPPEQRSYLSAVVILFLLGSFVVLGTYTMRLGQVTVRMAELFSEGEHGSSVTARQIARHATWEMAQDNLVYGWGAGGFRFYFPVYQVKYPEITQDNDQHLFWQYPHNDYVQSLAEFGLVGCSLLVLMLGYGSWLLIRFHFWRNPLVLFSVFGLLITLVHAWVDFQFQNPAILTTWCVLLVGMSRWVQLEETRSRK